MDTFIMTSSTRSSSSGADIFSMTSAQKRTYTKLVAGSIVTYWVFVSIIPIYNKYYLHRSQYPYPIASAGIQLGIVSLILAMYSILWHYVSPYQHASSQHEATTTMDTIIMSQSRIRSWIFGPGFIYKIQWTAPIGLLFGLKYGVTNLGLAMLPAPTHLLLQSTDLIWTCVAAWFIKDERLSPVGYACIAACVVGSAITSLSAAASTASNHDMWNSSRDTNMTTTTTTTTSTSIPPMFQFYENTMWAILINLLSPMLLGLCIAALRVSCKRLLIPCNPNLGGTTMDSSELTCWKLFVSAIVALLLACLMEGPKCTVQGNALVAVEDDLSSLEDKADLVWMDSDWYTAFWNLNSSTRLGVVVGSLFILIFQVNCTYLTYLTSAYTLGIVGQLKIVPQWIFAALIAPMGESFSFHLHISNVVGAMITMIAATVFAISNHNEREQSLFGSSRNDCCNTHSELLQTAEAMGNGDCETTKLLKQPGLPYTFTA